LTHSSFVTGTGYALHKISETAANSMKRPGTEEKKEKGTYKRGREK
jgi:hypothetical protein